MLLSNVLIGLHHLTLAAAPPPVIDDCIFGGVCFEPGPVEPVSTAFKGAIFSLLKYFFDDPDSIYQTVLIPCQIIAGLGALYLLVPLMLDFGKQNYGMNINKIILLFILMLMFASNGKLGKSIAFGNYAFIRGIDKLLVYQISNSRELDRTINDFKNDKQKVLQINTKLSKCNSIAEKTKLDDRGLVIPNPAFTRCDEELRALITNARFTNILTTLDFASAVSEEDFDDMASKIYNSSLGFSDVSVALTNDEAQKSQGIKNVLIGWRAAIAIFPDVALILALLYFPFPLAFSFLSTSYLQAWFSALWSVGLFKFAMTIFDPAFTIIEAALAGHMPQNTIDLAMGIAAPSIALALATGSGLGLSGLVGQGVSTLSSQLTSTPPGTGDAVRNGTPIKKT
jgi:hypothetical protein